MKKYQSGVSLSGLLMSAVVLAVVAMLGMKVGPEYLEYYQIVKVVKRVANDPAGQATVAEVRRAFDNFAVVDNIKAITAQDLEVTKEGGTLVISFGYERRVPLFHNVSLMFDFQGSSRD